MPRHMRPRAIVPWKLTRHRRATSARRRRRSSRVLEHLRQYASRRQSKVQLRQGQRPAEKGAPTTGRAVAARSRFARGAGKTGSYPTDDDLQQGRPSAMGRERARVSDLQACKQNKVRRGSEKGWFPALVLGQA